MQHKILMDDVEIAQPDALGYSFETTYTADSGRVQTGTAITSSMFTVEAFSFSYSSLTWAEARLIVRKIIKGNPVKLKYPSIYHGGWREGYFYVGKGETNWGSVVVDEELIEDFKFNAVGVEPL